MRALWHGEAGTLVLMISETSQSIWCRFNWITFKKNKQKKKQTKQVVKQFGDADASIKARHSHTPKTCVPIQRWVRCEWLSTQGSRWWFTQVLWFPNFKGWGALSLGTHPGMLVKQSWDDVKGLLSSAVVFTVALQRDGCGSRRSFSGYTISLQPLGFPPAHQTLLSGLISNSKLSSRVNASG